MSSSYILCQITWLLFWILYPLLSNTYFSQFLIFFSDQPTSYPAHHLWKSHMMQFKVVNSQDIAVTYPTFLC